jgi:hypothetical protein
MARCFGSRMIPAGVIAVLVVGAAPAPAARKPVDPVKRQLTQVLVTLRATSATRFASHRKPRLVTLARRAAAATRRPCVALARADDLRLRLADPANWHGRKVPRALVRGLRSRLAASSRNLLRRAGRRCALPARTKRVGAKRAHGGYTPLKRPDAIPSQGEQEEGFDVPAGKFKPVKRPGATSGIGGDPRAPGPAGETTAGARLRDAPTDPLRFFRISDLGTPPAVGGVYEPNAAFGENGVALASGNSSIAFSTNSGRTFTTLNPSTVLPDPPGQPFCCDQVVGYSKRYHVFFWLMQYWCGQGTSSPATNRCDAAGTLKNRLRIAVASPAGIRANFASAWTYWDFPPELFGHNGSSAWFDYSQIAVNRSTVTFAVHAIRGSGSGHGSLMGRISLAQLTARGTITIAYAYDGAAGTMKPVQDDTHSTTYIAGNETASRARIWSWAKNSGTLFLHGTDRSSIPIWNSAITGTGNTVLGNTDWYNRYGIFPGQATSATIRGNELWVSHGTGRAYCTSGCGRGETPVLRQVFPQPAIHVEVIDLRDYHLVRERWLWNPTQAFGYPALATSADHNEVGITFMYANSQPGNALPVAGYLTGGEEFVSALPAANAYLAGDYYNLGPGSTSKSFAFTAATNQTDPDGADRVHWHFVEYGRGAAPQRFAPNVAISSPAAGRIFLAGQAITYVADVNDPQDGALPRDAIVWREDGAIIGRGARITRLGTAVGTHNVSVTATNGEALSASAQIVVTVQPPASNAPFAQITSPPDNSLLLAQGNPDPANQQYYRDVAFAASASDPDGDPLTYRWTDTVNGGMPVDVSTVLSPTLRLYVPPNSPSGTATHDLVLSVSDGTHLTAVPIRVRVYVPG